MASDFKMDGIEKMLQRLERLDQRMTTAEDFALREAGKVVQKKMKENVNRSNKNQPHIQDHISLSIRDVDGVQTAIIAPLSKLAWRAKFLEFGTSKMSARPFVEPSIVESKMEVKTVLGVVLKKGFTS
ncbi:HK97-gp10 family putative phage morphogenesis protein [Thermoactinomyces sp. DSM 45892]|uniref:HK97-gp10 family putative phage morphogenesis protein n=1 Tax=Thermoactinomyces sp. DSM 45892 TaxID=1882753 RepID=UPI0008952AAE|nr:HK97-gp10 family putative phage morphogenesis protein [Thermoactinomyces sp. DSM 45892]SDY69451.1 phage protein, HK97 gp10 family [Thermoactinomyces sp. DSM 45892]